MHARSMTTRCVHRVRELEPILKLLSNPACKASVFQSSRYIVTMQRSSELVLPTYGSYILYPQSSTPSYLAVVTSDSDELCVMLFYVLFFLPPSRIIFKSLHFFTGMPTIAVQSSYSLHISACIGYIHTMVSLQMLKPLTSRRACGLLQPVCRYRYGKQM